MKSTLYNWLKSPLEGRPGPDAAPPIVDRFENRKDESSSKTPYLDDPSSRFYVSVDSKEQIGGVSDIFWPLFGLLGAHSARRIVHTSGPKPQRIKSKRNNTKRNVSANAGRRPRDEHAFPPGSLCSATGGKADFHIITKIYHLLRYGR